MEYIDFFSRGNVLVKNPSNTSTCSMDGKRGKPLALIMRPLPEGIKRVKPMTNNKHGKLMFGSRPIELTLGAMKYIDFYSYFVKLKVM
jgi:hypothetical protein